MDARTKRILLRFASSIIVLIVAVVIVELVHSEELRTVGIGLAVAAIFSLEQYLKNSGDEAPPSVGAVNAALETNSVVPPPKVKLQK